MALKSIFVFLGLLNFAFVAESFISIFGGYEVFIFNDPNQEWVLYLLRFTILSTFLFLVLFSFRVFTPFTIFRQMWSSKKSKRFFSAVALFVTSIYACVALTYWIYSEFSFSQVLRQTVYPSPSHQKAVIFKEIQYPHASLNIAYEKRGFFQKKAFMEINLNNSQSTSESSKVSLNVLDKLHDPSHVKINWSKDEESLIWAIETESNSVVTGVVRFD